MCPERAPADARQGGFSLVTAIFLLVILSALGAFLLTVSSLQHMGSALDVQGARAYQAARAGIEWGAFNVLTPPAAPACPAATNLGFGGTGLADFTTTATCAASAATEAGNPVTTYLITATACNQPNAGACPNSVAPGANYVERELTVTVSR